MIQFRLLFVPFLVPRDDYTLTLVLPLYNVYGNPDLGN